MPTTSASSRIEVRICRARGADRPGRRELTRALRDRDRERVRDHEAADEERDPAEREQEAAQERDEGVRLRGVVAAPAAVAVFTCAVGGTFCRSSLDELLVGDAGLRGDRDLVQPAALAEQLLRGRQVKPARVAPPIVETDPKWTKPEMRSRCAAPSACTPIVWPTLKSSLFAVDSSITTSPRPGQAPSDERERIEAGVAVGDAEAEVRRAAVDDRLAVVPDQLRLAVDAPLGRFDVGQAANLAAAATRRGSAQSSPCPRRDRRRSSR